MDKLFWIEQTTRLVILSKWFLCEYIQINLAISCDNNQYQSFNWFCNSTYSLIVCDTVDMNNRCPKLCFWDPILVPIMLYLKYVYIAINKSWTKREISRTERLTSMVALFSTLNKQMYCSFEQIICSSWGSGGICLHQWASVRWTANYPIQYRWNTSKLGKQYWIKI